MTSLILWNIFKKNCFYMYSAKSTLCGRGPYKNVIIIIILLMTSNDLNVLIAVGNLFCFGLETSMVL